MELSLRKLAAAAAVSLALSGQAHSTGLIAGATEITQILNNIELAMQTATQYTQYYTQLEQLYYQQLSNIPGTDGSMLNDISRLANTVNAARGAISASQELEQTLGSLHTVGTARFQNFVASGLNWESYVDREMALASQKRDRAKILSRTEEAAIERVQETWTTLQQYQNEIPTTAGEHQALRVMNGQMNSLAGTLNTLLHVSTARSSAETEKEFVEGMREEEQVKRRNEKLDRMKENRQYGVDQLQRLKSWDL